MQEETVYQQTHTELSDRYERWQTPSTRAMLQVKSTVRAALADFLRSHGFVEISPVIISPVTDPLNHEVKNTRITCYGHPYTLTQSMIFHKQLALLATEKIFCFSPNVRLEPPEKAAGGNHLFEFTQLDVEVRDASREKVMELAERLLIYAIQKVKTTCSRELESLGRTLSVPERPFPRRSFASARREHGSAYEAGVSAASSDPVWIVDFPMWDREFYDREHPHRQGWLRDMDLIYPDGYGEALSGGEREHDYARIQQRIRQSDCEPADFAAYLDLVKQGVHPSAGFGIGLERLVRYLCGFSDIQQAALFPKVPGRRCL